MYAFFNQGTDRNSTGATVEVESGELLGGGGVSDEGRVALEELKRRLEAARAESGKRQARWEAMVAAGSEPRVRWELLRTTEAVTAGGAELLVQADGSLLLQGRAGGNDEFVVKGEAGRVAAVRLEVLTDPSLPKNGPGTAGNGNFVLTGFEVLAGGKPARVKVVLGSHWQPGFPAAAAVDGDPGTGWAINVGEGTSAGVAMNARHEVYFVFEEPLDAGAGELEVRMRHDQNENYLVGRFRLSVAELAPPAGPLDDGERKAVEAAVEKAAGDRSGEEKAMLAAVFRRIDPVQGVLVEELAALELEVLGRKKVVGKVMVMEDLAEAKRRKTYVQLRGDFLNPDTARGELSPGVPGVFGVGGVGMSDRRDLADWLVDAGNPLTARVAVNRMWMRYFGRGLVETENDFGLQGSLPSHPELLDWLAGEFVRGGWSMKAVHRLIVTSATYRQSSAWRADLAERDARNLLLARQSRTRVEAEVVRDVALSASGLLDETVGGPSVYPPQPEGVYAFTQNRKNWRTSTGGDRFRRTMYTFFYRSAPHPLLTTF
ncbi:MAG: DUF1553 domain-containing protein, partial [Verrucomicrobiales bacterium]|nr:DUF1553 domain-containing protein [Verrucomicrobiales bacterium]